jgi:hypothetical protein
VKPIFSRQSLRRKHRTPLLPTTALGRSQERQAVPDVPPSPVALCAKTRDEAIAYGNDLIQALSAHLRQGELPYLEAIWAMLPYHVSVVHVANFALTNASATVPVQAPARDPAVPEYIISSRFLSECLAYLTADPNGYERLHLVTGIALDSHRYTLDQMEKVVLSDQSIGGAQADQHALTQALIHLTETGHALHGLFHSHPRQGPAATHPSDIDVATHQRYETGDYPLIGAIFVKSGHVRFFSTNRPFTITIYGTGVTPVPGEHHVYQIATRTRRVSYETIVAEE